MAKVQLSFPGLDKGALGITDLYSSQKNSVWRILQNRGALIDHEVGLGKTPKQSRTGAEGKKNALVYSACIVMVFTLVGF